jgi:YD repeat-containing protein
LPCRHDVLNRFVRAVRISLAVFAVSFATATFAQGLSHPPRQDARSPTGVSYGSGSFTYEARDLSIGGDFPQGLTLDRTYISNVGYATLGSQGWTHNWSGRVVPVQLPIQPDGPYSDPKRVPWVYNVSVGGKAVGFRGGSTFPPTTGGPVGTYQPITPSGATLVYTGVSTNDGRYVFTDGDGSVINFPIARQPFEIQDWTMPDGTRLDFTSDPATGLTRSVISNRGYALLFEPLALGQRKVCAVNMAVHYVTPTSSCPAGVQTVTYSYANGTFNPTQSLLSAATDANGQTTTYSYVGRDRLGCITPPGQSGCQIQNSYEICYEYPPGSPTEARIDYVASQVSATGETYGYAYSFDFPDPEKCNPLSTGTTMTVNATAVTQIGGVNSAGLPTVIVDPLGRTTNLAYESGGGLEDEPAELAGVQNPVGNAVDYYHDSRGNLVRQVARAVTGSGLADIETTAVFPSTCVDRKTCNKPTSTTDARGATTDYTYDPAHGGVLTETGPAVPTRQPNGTMADVRPQKRYAYGQFYAWIKNSSGGYSQAATPVWLLTRESFCRTSAATGNPSSPCAANNQTYNDEVVTAYDYGPAAGPNNLLVRGILVTADGQSLRTCYGYDAQGNRISETRPNANPGSCP